MSLKLSGGCQSLDGLTFFDPYVKSHIRSLGVMLETNLTFDKQVKSVVKSRVNLKYGFSSKVKPFLTVPDFEKVIHAFVTTRLPLDYCNSLYVGLNKATLSRLQLVQNAAALLLTGTRKGEHNISHIIATLHWLPVHRRIHFKILLLTFKCLNGKAPM